MSKGIRKEKRFVNETVCLATSFMIIMLYACITPYEFSGMTGLRRILVVEGVITDSVTTVRLSRSVGLSDRLNDYVYVDNGMIFVECDDGTVSDTSRFAGLGNYHIITGDLNLSRKYRLRILLDGEEYRSEFLQPMLTPDFELSWVKEGDGAKVSIRISTRDTLGQSTFYLWSYMEDWEIKARLLVDSFCIDSKWVFNDIFAPDNRYWCWKTDSSRMFILGNVEGMTGHAITNREIRSFFASNERLSLLYHISVKQHLIRKEAYKYYANMQKNLEDIGSIFAPIPSEIPGNLYCFTTPDIPVIGYVEVSTKSERRQFISAEEAYIESVYNEYDCSIEIPPGGYTPPQCFNTDRYQWVHYINEKWIYNPQCVDCQAAGGTKNKPSWWPTSHL